MFADSPRQIERLYAIFEDLEKKHQIKNNVEFTTLHLSLHEVIAKTENNTNIEHDAVIIFVVLLITK